MAIVDVVLGGGRTEKARAIEKRCDLTGFSSPVFRIKAFHRPQVLNFQTLPWLFVTKGHNAGLQFLRW